MTIISTIPTPILSLHSHTEITIDHHLTQGREAVSKLANQFLQGKSDLRKQIEFVRNNAHVIKEILQDGNASESERSDVLALLRNIFERSLELGKSTKSLTQEQFRNIDDALSLIVFINQGKGTEKQYKNILTKFAKITDFGPTTTSTIQVANPTIEQIASEKEALEYEKQQIKELDQLLNDKTEQKQESAQAVAKSTNTTDTASIEEFLLYAYGNDELNQRLKRKQVRTTAEQFLYDYTFATIPSNKAHAKLGPSQIRNSIQEVKSAFEKHKLTTACDQLRAVEQFERELYKKNSKLESSDPVHTAINKLFEIYKAPDKTLWEIRKDSVAVKAKEIKELIESSGNKEQYNDISKNLSALIEKLETGSKILDSFLASEETGQKVSYLTLSNLKKYDALATVLRPLAEKCDNFKQENILRAFINECEEAEDIMFDLRFLAEVTTAHQPGDIALEDEALHKKFNASSDIPFSQPYLVFTKSPLKTISNIKKFIDNIFTKGFWSLAAFTGPKHARMFFPAKVVNTATVTTGVVDKARRKKRKRPKEVVQGGEVVLSEEKYGLIQQKCQEKYKGNVQKYLESPEAKTDLEEQANKLQEGGFLTASIPRTVEITSARGADFGPIEIEQSLYELHYRPDFDKILTQDAKNKKIDSQAVEKIYKQKLQAIVEGDSHFIERSKYQIDPARAGASALMSWIPNLGPLKLKLLARNIVLFLFGDKGVLRPLLESRLQRATSIHEAKEAIADAHKRFCSELVSEITKAALEATEAELKKTQGTNTVYLNKVFPDHIDLSEIYPGKLQGMISQNEYFKKIDPPAVLTKLFERVDQESVH